MDEVAVIPDEKLRTPTSGRAVALLIGGTLLCLMGLPLSLGRQWPPGPPDGGRIFEWALSVLLIVAALGISRTSYLLWVRTACGLALIICSVANAIAVIFEAWNEVDDPLSGLLVLVAVLSVGGWFCRQRILGCAAIAAFALVAGSALTPGRQVVRIEKDGIQATLTSLGREGSSKWARVRSTFSSESGAPIDRVADLRIVRISSTAGFLLPVHCQDMIMPLGFEDAMSLSPYVPDWVASEDFGLTVQKWPAAPLVQVQVVLKKSPSGSVRARQGEAWIEVGALRPSQRTNSFPPEPCLATQLSFGGPGISEYERGEVRVIDDKGRPVEIESSGGPTDGDEAEDRYELSDVANGTKWLDFCIYSRAQLDSNKVTFNFDRMATR